MSWFRRKSVESAVEEGPGKRWSKGEREIARRFDEADLAGACRAGVAIESGTRALFFQGGRLIKILEPGFLSLARFQQALGPLRAKEPVAVVIVDGADVPISASFGDDLRTKEGHRVVVEFQLNLVVADPMCFYVQVMKRRGAFTDAELFGGLARHVHGLLRDILAAKPLQTLSGESFKAEIGLKLEQLMRPLLGRAGLELPQVHIIGVSVPARDELLDKRAALQVEQEARRIEEARQELLAEARKKADRKRLDDLAQSEAFAAEAQKYAVAKAEREARLAEKEGEIEFLRKEKGLINEKRLKKALLELKEMEAQASLKLKEEKVESAVRMLAMVRRGEAGAAADPGLSAARDAPLGGERDELLCPACKKLVEVAPGQTHCPKCRRKLRPDGG